ncbi:hypothetical protein ABE10_02930, partial [Bacillus toyonensis]|nr:hypothetical protein [Bacillus toyonensis]
REELLRHRVDLEVHQPEVLAILAGGDHGASVDHVIVGEVGVRRDDRVHLRRHVVDDPAERRIGSDAGHIGRDRPLMHEQEDHVGLAVGRIAVLEVGGDAVDRVGDAAHLEPLHPVRRHQG